MVTIIPKKVILGGGVAASGTRQKLKLDTLKKREEDDKEFVEAPVQHQEELAQMAIDENIEEDNPVIKTINPDTADTLRPYIDPTEEDITPIGEVSKWDSFKAGVARESFVSTGFIKQTFIEPFQYEIDPTFNPIDYVKGTRYDNEIYAPFIARARNLQHLDAIIKNLDQKEIQLRTLGSNTFSGLAGAMVGAVLDPVMFVPVVGAARGASRLASAFRLGSQTAASSAILEVMARPLDQTRTLNESVVNVIGAGLFAGVLGSILPPKKLATPEIKDIHKTAANLADETLAPKTTVESLQKEITTAVPESLDDIAPVRDVPGIDEAIPSARGVDGEAKIGFEANVEQPKRSLNEIAADNSKKFGFDEVTEPADNAFRFDTDAENYKILGHDNPIFKPILKMAKGFNMILRGLNAKGAKARQLTSDLFSHNFDLKGSKKGIAKPIALESKIRLDAAEGKRVFFELDEVYSSYRGKGDFDADFNTYKAAIYDEINVPGKSKSKAVKEGAALLKKRYDSAYSRGVKSGVFKKGGATENYTPRMFDFEGIQADLPGFKKSLGEGILELDPRIAPDELAREVDNIVNKVYDPTTPMFRSFEFKGKATKERTLNIPYKHLEKYLEKDLDVINGKYYQDLAVEVNFKERYGSTDLAPQIKEVIDEYDELISKAGSDKKEASRLLNEKKQTVLDIENARDMLQGRFDSGGSQGYKKFESAMLAWNTVTMLGLSVISQVADMGRMIGVVRLTGSHRFTNFIDDVVKPFKKIKLDKADWRYLQEGMDTHELRTAGRFADLEDTVQFRTKFQKGINTALEHFFNLNLMTPFNMVTRRASINHIMNNMLEAASKWSKGVADEFEIQDLLKVGIDAKQRDKFLRLMKKHGEVVDEVFMPHFDKWGPEGADILASIKAEVDNVILVPGLGDKPTWMKRAFYKLVGQFKGFSASAFVRSLMPNLQDIFVNGGRKGVKAAARMSSGVALGSLAYVVRQKFKNQEVDYSPKRLIVEGFDRGGIFPVISDANNVLDSAQLGLGSLLGVGKASRFKHNDILAPLLGPTASKTNDLAKALGAFKDGNITDSELRLITRQVPMNNLLYFNWLTSNIGK